MPAKITERTADTTAITEGDRTPPPTTEDQHEVDARLLDVARRMEPYERRRAGAEDAFAVLALIELHRVGLNAPTGAPDRYLDAARRLGDDMVTAILGPVETDPPAPTA